METYRDVLTQAQKSGVAVGHFNISDSNQLRGIFQSAKKLHTPVIIGISEGERNFIGLRQAVALVKSLRKEHDYPIFINADHTYSVEGCKESIDAGIDSVIFDGAKLSLEENIAKTKEVVDYAREHNGDILVEGELGYIGTSSKVLDEIPEGVSPENLTTPEDAKQYVEKTGVGLLAPSVGNIHGMLKDAKNPELNIERIKEIHGAAGVPLVLHGGSGISDENFREAIKAGMSIVHINTEIRRAYREGIEKSLQEHPDEIAPYRMLAPGVEALSQVVEKRIRLFNNM